MSVAVQLLIAQVHVGPNIIFFLRNVEILRNAQFVYQEVQGPHYFYSGLLDIILKLGSYCLTSLQTIVDPLGPKP